MGRAAPPLTDPQRELAARHVKLVYQLAKQLAARLSSTVDRDDLVSDGWLGLLRAARRFDPAHRVQFETFAGKCIHGAMLDGLRNRMFISRQARQRGEAEPAFHSVDATCAAGDTRDVRWADVLAARPEAETDEQRMDALDAVIGRGLPAKQRHVLRRYYGDGMQQKQIAGEIGCHESYVSHLRAQALRTLRQAMACGE